MDIKKISLDFDMGQVCNDVLVKCFVISQSLMDEAQQEIKASIQSPDAPETRSIINRAVTEAIGNLKVAAQRYLTTGRTEDNNSLERLVAGSKEYSYADNGMVRGRRLLPLPRMAIRMMKLVLFMRGARRGLIWNMRR